jgi:micrococcal nuclease
MKDKIQDLIANIKFAELELNNLRISKQVTIVLGVGIGLIGLFLCFLMVSVVGSALASDEPAAAAEFKPLPTLVPRASVSGESSLGEPDLPAVSSLLPPTNTPRPTVAAYVTNTPIPTFSEGVGLPHPPGDIVRVTQIIDGITIEVEMDGTTYQVRYIGLETPEQGTSYFEEAIAANEALVSGQEVVLVKDVTEADQLSRLMRYVYRTDGTFVNAELVKQGFATAALQPPDVLHHDEFVELQLDSQSSRQGIWNPSAN